MATFIEGDLPTTGTLWDALMGKLAPKKVLNDMTTADQALLVAVTWAINDDDRFYGKKRVFKTPLSEAIRTVLAGIDGAGIKRVRAQLHAIGAYSTDPATMLAHFADLDEPGVSDTLVRIRNLKIEVLASRRSLAERYKGRATPAFTGDLLPARSPAVQAAALLRRPDLDRHEAADLIDKLGERAGVVAKLVLDALKAVDQ